MTVHRNGGAAVVETLAAHGVDTIFGIPGTHNLELYRWFTPTLHLDTHMKLVQYIKIGQQVVGLGTEWVRAPRLPLEGEERKRILGLYETAVANRPQLKKAAE